MIKSVIVNISNATLSYFVQYIFNGTDLTASLLDTSVWCALFKNQHIICFKLTKIECSYIS